MKVTEEVVVQASAQGNFWSLGLCGFNKEAQVTVSCKREDEGNKEK